ncbi:NCS2 family permease [Clostridium sp. P21]|uniref:NCS2 family permease n=1 Tax=Clostridium muellerianum TaxID=2716538 RepID=A0A7Y0HN63_9CLOT|nr:NCS2 family permease [Clostridium muellerianum]NMM62327.1 NCS2 family permease [Clostridium muellerianum]
MQKEVQGRRGSFLESLFKLKENNTNVKTEILAGITTFITMAYIIFVNPSVLRIAGMNSGNVLGDAAAKYNVGTDPVVSAVFVATCLAAAVGTFIMGFYANLPFAQAPGMGLNAFFTYTVCLTLGFTWHQALSAVLMSGILFIIITVTSIREKIVDAIPQNLKYAMSGGIGLFIALIGLKSGGIIVSSQATLVSFGNFAKPGTLLTIMGVIIIGILMSRNVTGSILIGIVLTTIIGIPLKVTSLANLHVFSAPPSLAPTSAAFDFSGLFSKGGVSVAGAVLSFVMVVITICLVDLFDTIGTLVGTATKAGMVDENGKVLRLKKALICDAIATTAGSFFGTSTVNTYVESTAGVTAGGRTGLTSVTVGVLFILSLFFSGLVGVVPSQATAPALIIVGALMMGVIKNINFDDFTEALPCFFAISLMAFSYSIANGIAVAMIVYPIVKIATGRHKELNPIVYILAVLFILRFILLPFE